MSHAREIMYANFVVRQLSWYSFTLIFSDVRTATRTTFGPLLAFMIFHLSKYIKCKFCTFKLNKPTLELNAFNKMLTNACWIIHDMFTEFLDEYLYQSWEILFINFYVEYPKHDRVVIWVHGKESDGVSSNAFLYTVNNLACFASRVFLLYKPQNAKKEISWPQIVHVNCKNLETEFDGSWLEEICSVHGAISTK